MSKPAPVTGITLLKFCKRHPLQKLKLKYCTGTNGDSEKMLNKDTRPCPTLDNYIIP